MSTSNSTPDLAHPTTTTTTTTTAGTSGASGDDGTSTGTAREVLKVLKDALDVWSRHKESLRAMVVSCEGKLVGADDETKQVAERLETELREWRELWSSSSRSSIKASSSEKVCHRW